MQDRLIGWEYKDVVIYWNPLTQAWEVNGKQFDEKDAAIASETWNSWQRFGVMEDGWAALPTAVSAAYASRADAVVYCAFYQRHKH